MTDTPLLGTVKEPQRDYRTLDRQKLTPMFQHYTEVKEQYQGALLLYRVGDFFECFFINEGKVLEETILIIINIYYLIFLYTIY